MVFNSLEFAAFFAVVTTLHFVLPARWRWLLLLVASYVFYASWNASYAVLILASTVIDFGLGRWIHTATDDRQRKAGVRLSLAMNLGLLFTFKYWTFFHTSMAAALIPLGVPYAVPELNVLLPVGISFYTFQTLSYTIDIYRRQLAPEPHFGRFALYVSFFPQLVAGPIERASRLLPQLRERTTFDAARVVSGLELMLWGLFKKVVIADRLAIYVDAVYNNPTEHNGLTALLATYAFAFQIYCDFSGYSDIAIGAARVLGYDLMENFRRPYFSQSITEFWRRWHISLSTWLRDYLYIPLGGNRHGEWNTYRNLMITMLLGGLWHGASWNFVIWGALQGVFLAFSRFTLPKRDALVERMGIPKPVVVWWRRFVTFHLVCFSWIFFRAVTFEDAWAIVTALPNLGAPFISLSVAAHAGIGLIVLAGVEFAREWRGVERPGTGGWPLALRWAAWLALSLMIVLLGVEQGASFIYFQF